MARTSTWRRGAPILAIAVALACAGSIGLGGVAYAAGPVISIGNATLSEGNVGNRTLYFNVTLSQPSASAVTVHYATSSVTATTGSDFVATTGNLTIPANTNVRWIAVPIKGDATSEANETFKVTLSAPVNGTLGVNKIGTGTIVNDEPAAAGPQVSIASASMTEGNIGARTFWFSITLSKPKATATTVKYSTQPDSALAGSDYTTKALAVATIAANQTSTFAFVAEAGDASSEPNETFKVVLSAASAGVTIKAGTAIATIVNDDTLPSTASSWGDNAVGTLGDPAVPTVAVLTPRHLGSAAWQSVATTPQASQAANLAIGTDGTLWAWGQNAYGQFGNGTHIGEATPVQVGTDTNWASVKLGSYHAVARKTDGTIWSWGFNAYGERGDGTTGEYQTTPEQIGTDTDWASISVGDYHTVAVKTDGTLWAWGYNADGGLGDGTTTNRTTPEQIGTDTDWAVAEGGTFHTAALKTDGTLWAWGYNGTGCLGDGTTVGHSAPAQIGTDTDWSGVSPGGLYTMAVKADGTLWGWGDNAAGELGDGTTTNRNAPAQIGTDSDWDNVAAELDHTTAVKANGTLWGWGANSKGQVGNGTTIAQLSPSQIGTETNWVVAYPGFRRTYAVKVDGSLWAWGENDTAQLGLGPSSRNAPGAVGTSGAFKSIAAGVEGFAVAVKGDGTLWAWGYNANAQLGDGTTTNRTAPVKIGTATNWASVTAGPDHVLALRTDGTLWGWGNNAYGFLGDGTTNSHSTPVKIGTANTWKSVSTGYVHTVATRTDGTLWAWGDNNYGQFGDGTTTSHLSPVKIGTATWKSVSAGFYRTTGLKTDGSLWSWGFNASGQLGDGTYTDRFAPVRLGAATTWKTVVAGAGDSRTTLAIRTDGSLWAWGLNGYGQFGDGTTTGSVTPKRIGVATNWEDVAVGPYHAVALKGDHSLWTWGINYYGQLGDGTNTDRLTPTHIGTATDWNKIAAGNSMTYALRN